MNGTKYFDKPRNVLPIARGPGHEKDFTFKFGKRDLQKGVKEEFNMYLGGILRKAVLSPGEWVREWFEENGYQYETHAKFDPDTNTILTNYLPCPSRYFHHIGSTCSVCEQKD
jgi:hypothetical protein